MQKIFFLPKSRYQWSRSGGGFCQPGHQRVSQSRASPETWLSWGQSARWQAMSQQCTPSHANLPGTLRWDYPEGNTRHPSEEHRMFKPDFPLGLCLKKKEKRNDTCMLEKGIILWTAAVWHCCCLGSITRGHEGSNLCSRSCRFPVQRTAHFGLCCEPGGYIKMDL